MCSKIKFVLLFALLAVSTSSIFARFLPDVSAVVISFWRLAIASVVLWIYSFFKKQGQLERTTLKLYVVSGFFLALHFTSFYAAVKLTSIANATLLGITAPMFTILFERFILKRSSSPLILLAFVSALVGTIIITGSGIVLSDGSLLGKLFGLIAALCIALVYILAENLRKNTNTLVYTRMLYTIGAMFLLLISLLNQENVLSIDGENIFWLISLGIIPTILGHSLFYYAIKYTSPTIIASIPLGEPIIASVLAWFIFFERIPLFTFIGGFLILCGVYLIVIYSPSSRLNDNY